MLETHVELVNKAMEAIEKLFSDQSVSNEKMHSSLNGLKEEILAMMHDLDKLT